MPRKDRQKPLLKSFAESIATIGKDKEKEQVLEQLVVPRFFRSGSVVELVQEQGKQISDMVALQDYIGTWERFGLVKYSRDVHGYVFVARQELYDKLVLQNPALVIEEHLRWKKKNETWAGEFPKNSTEFEIEARYHTNQLAKLAK